MHADLERPHHFSGPWCMFFSSIGLDLGPGPDPKPSGKCFSEPPGPLPENFPEPPSPIPKYFFMCGPIDRPVQNGPGFWSDFLFTGIWFCTRNGQTYQDVVHFGSGFRDRSFAARSVQARGCGACRAAHSLRGYPLSLNGVTQLRLGR